MILSVSGQWTPQAPATCELPSEVAWRTQGDGPAVVLDGMAFAEVESFLRHDVSREHGGFLLGNVARGPTGVECLATVVRLAIPCLDAEGSMTHLTLDHRCWQLVHSHPAVQDGTESIVGWFHSHPGMTLRMSPRDEFIHAAFFEQPWQVAWIMDPIAGSHAFYTRDERGFVPFMSIGLLEHEVA